MSASHGRLGSSAFRLSTTSVSMSFAGSCFSSESAPRPFHHGIRRRGRTIYWAALPEKFGSPSSVERLKSPVERVGYPEAFAAALGSCFQRAPSQNKDVYETKSKTDDPNSERRYRPAARFENEKDDTGSQKCEPDNFQRQCGMQAR